MEAADDRRRSDQYDQRQNLQDSYANRSHEDVQPARRFGHWSRPCLIRCITLRTRWLIHERRPPQTMYTDATGTSVPISRLIYMDLQIGDPRKSVAFAISNDLAVPVIVGTEYKDKLIAFIQF